jgi:hypothetical protein
VTSLRLLLLSLLLGLGLPQAALGQAASEESAQDEGTEAPGPGANAVGELSEWWELHPRPSDGWRLGIQLEVRRHRNSWVIPVGIVGTLGLTAVAIGAGMSIASPFNEPIPLVLGVGTLGITSAMAAASFPALASISRALERLDDPVRLHTFLKRTRRTLGIVSIVLGSAGLVSGLMAPFTFGLSAIPSVALTTAGVMLGQAALTFLIFERKVGHFTTTLDSSGRFGKRPLPRRPTPPRLVSASPLSVTLVF